MGKHHHKPSNDAAATLRDAQRGVRLHKALADMGVGSRRACEKLIDEHRVAVNGIVIDFAPAFVDVRRDRIQIDGEPVGRPRRASHLYLMVNKPRGVICTNDDPQGRKRIIDLVPHEQRLFCVGRLDAESTGLVLLTDDGDLAHHLTHPRYGVSKTYEASIRGELSTEDIERLRGGLWLADRGGKSAKARAESVRKLAGDREKTRLLVTLREGRNREIRRLMARLGHKVRRLKRVGLGPLKLKAVGVGEWRPLTHAEINALRRTAKTAAARSK